MKTRPLDIHSVLLKVNPDDITQPNGSQALPDSWCYAKSLETIPPSQSAFHAGFALSLGICSGSYIYIYIYVYIWIHFQKEGETYI